MSEPVEQIFGDFAEHYRLLDEMESAGLPEQLDQDARDLHRLIHEQAPNYKGTSFGDMTLPLARSLHRLVLAASQSASLAAMQKELEEAREEAQTFHTRIIVLNRDYAAQAERIAALEEELEEARKDSDTLNALGHALGRCYCTDSGCYTVEPEILMERVRELSAMERGGWDREIAQAERVARLEEALRNVLKAEGADKPCDMPGCEICKFYEDARAALAPPTP